MIYASWCETLEEMGEHRNAIEKCEQAIELDPEGQAAIDAWKVLQRLKAANGGE